MAKNSKAVAKLEETKKTSLVVQTEPDYLTGKESLGIETLGKGDFKIPRIKLLQPLSPEIRSFQGTAIPSEFWHTGVNKSLSKEFLFVPAIVNKRVVVWRPREDGDGGILAFSRDARKWDTGANESFEVKLKGIKKPVIWKTGKDVQSSGLLEFGTSNPEDPQSAPAATLVYEYLVYLIDYPDFSPVVLGVSKTGVGNARALNTYLLGSRKPTTCMVVRCFADEEQKGQNIWHVPKFDPAGFTNKDVFDMCEKLKKTHADYETEIQPEEEPQPVDSIDY